MNPWNIIKKLLEEEEIVKISNGLNPLSSKPQIKNIKEYHNKKKEASRVEAPVASTSNPQVSQTPQEGKKNKKRSWKKPYSPNYRIPSIQKDSMEKTFNVARNLMEFKEKDEQKNETTIFPKEKKSLHIL
ncbi:hypothetical protein O181_132732 [Austropuccinia psidii MF-1]|uniref:Uncharacterized protein n=1 Tax=Austropuccinia psidii MF-1 TaxID=1389203 RepID=A0A9Q3QE15_9BASI|nr:hypothetical protein [Austropuccinia psidii MF-1]